MIKTTAIRNFPLPAALLISVLLLASGVARADSDGYYCAGRGYLAYQLNEQTPRSEGHLLYLVELDPAKGISDPRRFPLESFQVLGMRCLDDAVDLLAWDRIYRINLKDGETPRIDKIEPQPEDSVFPDFTSNNLGRWSMRSQTIPLKTADGRFRFDLVIDLRPDPAAPSRPGPDRERIRSLIRQKDAKGTVREQEIFSGTRAATDH